MKVSITDKDKKILSITMTDKEWNEVDLVSSIDPEKIKAFGMVAKWSLDRIALDELQHCDEIEIQIWREKVLES